MAIKSISVKSYELIKPDSEIYVESTIPFEPKSALGSIQLRGTQGNVTLAKEDKLAIWKPEGSIPEGHHIFEVDELSFVDGTKHENTIQIPLFVLDSNVHLPNNLTIHNISRLGVNGTKIKRIPLGSAKGNYIEMIKAIDKNGKQLDLAFDKKGNRIDAKKIFEDYDKNYAEKYGKIHESLYEELNKKKESDLISVAIWLDIKPRNSKPEDKKRYESEHKKLKNDIQIIGKAFSNKIKEEFKIDTIRIDSSAPVVYTSLTKSQISLLTKDKDVSRIFLYEPEGIDDLQNSINIAYSNNVHASGVGGSDVKVAVWERGPDITTDLVISAAFDTSSTAAESSHARLTTAVIRNSERNKPHGHAPSCIIYSANSYSTSALSWAVDKGCTVISQSFHRDSEQTSDTLSFEDILKDWLVLHPPYPTILQAAGNGNSNEFVNHKGFNSLAIGNHNDAASTMSGSSVFRNPKSVHGDRELPELCANGIGVSAVGLNMSGTSFAAPAIAGITALIQEADSILKDWPEACRAILLAGANRSVTGNTWWSDVLSGIDAKDGAGAANADQSYVIAENRVVRNGIAEHGWHAGTLSSVDFNSDGKTTFTYSVKTPASGWSPFARVKIALAWDSEVTGSIVPSFLSSHLKLDLDLWVYDSNNNLVASSASWDNSYEIAEFPARANTTYTIKIGRWSGSNDIWYGIAWNVYGFLVADPGLNVSL